MLRSLIVTATLVISASALLALAPKKPAAAPIRYVLAGGGWTAEYDQVSIEQDVALARSVFGPDGILLFAGGPGSPTVRVLDEKQRGDPLVATLADIFDSHDGYDSHYEKVTVPASGPFTDLAFEQALRRALGRGHDPLLVYVAAHGEFGGDRRDDAIDTWGMIQYPVSDMASLLAGAPHRREVRLVMTQCFSGGFADLVFKDADSNKGKAAGRLCGLFASTWDRPASGCDPNPDRGSQEGYGIYFLHALKGEDRSGHTLPRREIDFDHDGRISLLEAHTRAVIAGRSFDVPTTTSERWLRAVAPKTGPSKKVKLPEVRAVVRALGKRLRLDEAGARTLRTELRKRIRLLRSEAHDADEEADVGRRTFTAHLLTRWPVLNDAFHPDFQKTVDTDRKAITDYLATNPSAKAWRKWRRHADDLEDRLADLKVKEAPVERLVRAYDTLELAGRLKAAGGAAWKHYREILACERGAP